MAQYDGSIRINTLINTQGARESLNGLAHAIVGTADRIASLRARMEELENQRTPTEEYRSLEEFINNTEASVERLTESMRRMEEDGLQDSDVYRDMSSTVQEMTEELERSRARLQELVDTGRGFELGSDSDEYRHLQEELENEERAMRKLAAQYKALNAAEKMREGFRKLGGAAKKGFSIIAGSAKGAGKEISSAGKRLIDLLGAALIFDSIKKAFDFMASGMEEGFENLYGEVDSFKSSVDGLKASSLTLKNSFAAAFRPLVETAIPYIQKTIDAVAGLMNIFGQFTAAVTGQETYTKAVKQTTDALEEEEKAGKKGLSSLDKLNNLSSGSGADEGGSGTMFEEVPVDESVKGLADKVRDAFAGIFDTFKEAWDNKGQKVISSAKTALEALGKAAEGVGETFYEVFTGDVGLGWVESGLELLRSMLDVITSISGAFSTAWDSGAGMENVEALFGMLTDVNGLLASIGDSFSRVFSGGIGAEIFGNILGIITGIYNTIGNIAERLTEAWNTAGLGDSIWSGILGIINTILGTIHNIADSTAEWAGKIDFTPLLTSIDGLLKALQPLAENIGAGLEWFWNNVLLPIAGWAVEDAVPAFLDMLSAAAGALNKVIEALKPLGEWLWENFLQPLGEWTGELIISAMETVTDLLTKFGDWVSEHQEAVQNFAIVIGSFAAAWGLVNAAVTIWSAVSAIATGATTALGAAVAFLTSPITIAVAIIGSLIAIGVLLYKNWDVVKEKAGQLADWISEKWEIFKLATETAWEAIKNAIEFAWNVIKTAVETAVGILQIAISNAWNAIQTVTSTVWNAIRFAIETVWNGIKTTVSTAVNAVKTVISVAWNAISYGVSTVWNGIWNTIRTVWGWITGGVSNAVNGVKSTITGVMETVKDVWDRIWDAVFQKVDDILGSIKRVIESVFGWISNMIDSVMGALRNLFSEAASAESIDTTPKGKGGGRAASAPMSAPMSVSASPFSALADAPIPRLATGAVIPANKEFLAVLGDQKHGRNLEAPEDLIRKIVREETAKADHGGEITVKVPVSINEKVIFEIVKKLDLEQYRRTGRPSFQI